MNQYYIDMLQNTNSIKTVDEVYQDNKKLDDESMFNLLVEYFTEFHKFGIYSSGVIAIGIMKEKGRKILFQV